MAYTMPPPKQLIWMRRLNASRIFFCLNRNTEGCGKNALVMCRRLLVEIPKELHDIGLGIMMDGNKETYVLMIASPVPVG